ncbi:MAG: leucine-rich repeat protein [Roseburia sp.]|nr:leucine-rich repeat protein [Roseburia sp.]
MKKKLIVSLITVALVVLSVFGLFACDENNSKNGEDNDAADCSHSWSAWRSLGANAHERTCSLCGEIESEAHTIVNNSCVCGYAAPIAITALDLDAATMTLRIDETGNLAVTVEPSSEQSQPLNWSSGNTAVATVNRGVVTGVGEGATQITVTAESGASASCTVTVTSQEYSAGFTFASLGAGYAVVGYDGHAAEVTVPSSHKSKPVTAVSGFDGNTELQKIILPDTINTIGQSAFDGCIELDTIAIPNSVNSIGANAFYGCTDLREIMIPNSVTGIGADAFKNCTLLKKVTVSDSLSSADIAGVFDGCHIEEATAPINAVSGIPQTHLIKIKLTSGSSIPDGLFEGYDALSEIEMPSTVTEIGENAFKNTALHDISGIDNVTEIGAGAFYDTNLTDFTVPSGVTTINADVFRDCTLLRNLVIPSGVTEISAGALRGCNDIQSITLPFVGTYKDTSRYEPNTPLDVFGVLFGYEVIHDNSPVSNATESKSYSESGTDTHCWYYMPQTLRSVILNGDSVSIPEYAFSRFYMITSVTLPDGLTSIPTNAFRLCNSLTHVVIPNTVNTIEASAFYCNELPKVYYKGTRAEFDQISVSPDENTAFINATVYCYSPTTPATSGNYWHYDTDGTTPVEW